jgi:5-methylcytosine-specific restriction enzyme A
MYPFKVGSKYTRNDVFSILNIIVGPHGDWYTGYHEHEIDWFIFCGIGTPGRTGHDYPNRFIGDELVWFGRNSSKIEHPSIQRLIQPDGDVYIFYRNEDRDPFTFAGLGKPRKVFDTSPVKIIWTFQEDNLFHPEFLPQEIHNSEHYSEGARKTITVNIYERDPNARMKCIEHWGDNCSICQFNFLEQYGEIGKGYIQVHHLKPLSELNDRYLVNPIQDLRPVCPNCHAMLHHSEKAMKIEELRELIQ